MGKKEKTIKIILIVFCVLLVLFIFVRNILGGIGKEEREPEVKELVDVNEISREEACRLISYLLYDGAEREELPQLTQHGLSTDHLYYSYVNAVAYVDFVHWEEAEQTSNFWSNALTCGEFRDMLVGISKQTGIEYKKIFEQLPKRFNSVKKEDTVRNFEFLKLYEILCVLLNDQVDTKPMKWVSLYLVGTEPTEYGTNQMKYLDASGKKYMGKATINYASILSGEDEIYPDTSQYLDKPLEFLIRGNELIYVRKELTEPVTLSNVYITTGKETELAVFLGGVTRNYETTLPLSQEIIDEIGDITIEEGKVTAIVVKPDKIGGKVLMTTEDEIEIEGYQRLPFDEDFRIYKVYGTLSMEQTGSILVGYSITDFVVSEGVVCAALIKESLRAENIRVLINTDGYKSLYHRSISLTANTPFLLQYGEEQTLCKEGEQITIAASDERLKQGRIKVTTSKEEGKITLLSVHRSYGKPEYRGSMEIAETTQGLLLINELSLEEYLYSVIPSEMPVSYGPEALKVQAVCARSYAYNQLLANKYSAYGAHVEDSVNSQVYNNIKESDETILAVKDTYGQVLAADDEIISAYYFSTSSGHTANVEDVWEYGVPKEYFTGQFQSEEKMMVDLSTEEAFQQFIDEAMVKNQEMNGTLLVSTATYDSDFSMYRWKVTLPQKRLSEQINETIKKLYAQSKQSVLSKTKKHVGENKEGTGLFLLDGVIYESQPVKDLGQITSLRVITRAKSGIVKELLITGTKNSVVVRYQHNIRQLLAPSKEVLYRMDESTIKGMTLLPSAFFYIVPKKTSGKVTGFELIGGGYGHGVGMSQNGAKAMTKAGKNYKEILEHYYSGITIGFVYEDE